MATISCAPLFAEAGSGGLMFFGLLVLIGMGLWKAYLMLYRPDVYRAEQERKEKIKGQFLGWASILGGWMLRKWGR